MQIVFLILRLLIVFPLFVLLALFVTVLFAVAGLLVWLFGKPATLRVYAHRGSDFPNSQSRPPMKDVTPADPPALKEW